MKNTFGIEVGDIFAERYGNEPYYSIRSSRFHPRISSMSAVSEASRAESTVKIDCKTGHAFLFNGEYR